MVHTLAPSSLDAHLPLLSLRSIHAGYGGRQVLNGTTFDVFANETVGLIGDNGAGKSTILRTVFGLLSPTSGDVLYCGRSIRGMLPHETQRCGIGYAMQGGRVFSNLTVAENISVASPKGTHECAGMPCDLFHRLRHLAAVRAGLLSGGERQVLAIQMVLAQHPRLLLLDEPTANLAPDLATEVIALIATFANLPGHAVIVVEQNRNVVRQLATRSLTVMRGSITDSSGTVIVRPPMEKETVL